MIIMASASIFSSKATNDFKSINSSTLNHGFAYICTWIAKIFALIAGVTNHKSAAKMQLPEPVEKPSTSAF